MEAIINSGASQRRPLPSCGNVIFHHKILVNIKRQKIYNLRIKNNNLAYLDLIASRSMVKLSLKGKL